MIAPVGAPRTIGQFPAAGAAQALVTFGVGSSIRISVGSGGHPRSR
jgi:hypothetical protein